MSDARAIDALAAAFFSAFDNRAGARPEIAPLRDLFLPGAIITKSAGGETVAMDVEGFIAPRAVLLTGGRLTEFHEWETAASTSICGGIAVRRCTYRKAGLMDGEATEGDGVKVLTCVRTAAGWRLAAVAWQDAEAAVPVTADFLA